MLLLIIDFTINYLYFSLGFVKSNPEPGMSPEEIINHSNSNTKVIENFNIKQPTTIGLNNHSNNNPNLMDGNNLFSNLGLDDKILNPRNYNGPISSSILKNNLPGGFNFKQTEIDSKSSNFLKKTQSRN